MTTLRLSNVAAKAGLDAITALLNAGGAGSLKFWTGAAPTNVEDAATGTLLGTCGLSATSFGASTDLNPGALATAAAVSSDTSADATGTAGYFRFLNNAGTAVIQGDCGTASATAIFNSVAITAGAQIDVTAATLTLPET